MVLDWLFQGDRRKAQEFERARLEREERERKAQELLKRIEISSFPVQFLSPEDVRLAAEKAGLSLFKFENYLWWLGQDAPSPALERELRHHRTGLLALVKIGTAGKGRAIKVSWDSGPSRPLFENPVPMTVEEILAAAQVEGVKFPRDGRLRWSENGRKIVGMRGKPSLTLRTLIGKHINDLESRLMAQAVPVVGRPLDSIARPSLRFAVMERDGYRCRYCGATAKDGIRLEVDHLLPVAKAGETTLDNLVTACEPCNRGKAARVVKAPPN